MHGVNGHLSGLLRLGNRVLPRRWASEPEAEGGGFLLQGATLAEIAERTGWQAHRLRRAVSGTLIKKLSLNVESFRSAEKAHYRVK